ncbi:MAG: hypothetical protein H5T69_03420 [Chloroflexi bacterium]|nr:hypothetical protein [Chloroflexota bacterium]
MIVLRVTYKPSEDMHRMRDLLVEWRDKHPEDGLRVYNSITGAQNVLVLEMTFKNDDLSGLARALFEPAKHYSPEMLEWLQKWQGLDAAWDTHELWRLAD